MLKVTPFGEVTRFDVARTLAGRGRYWTTCYLVEGTMIDTGCAHCREELVDAIGDEPVDRVLNTHCHEDHIGANGRLQRDSHGLEILAHTMALPVLADPRGRQPLHPYRKVMWGQPEPSSASAIADGEVVETTNLSLTAIHTPGHSPDHLCFFEPERGWLFTGDLYVGGKDRALRVGYDIWEIVASLKRVAALDVQVLFPGSARVPDDAAAALTNKIEHLERLGEQVLELDRHGLTVREIVRRLCGPRMPIELLTLGHFSRRNLVLSYLGRSHDPADIRWSDRTARRPGPEVER